MLYYYKYINEGGKYIWQEYVSGNINQIGEREYQTVIDGQELAEMWRDEVITYNPEIQRGTKVKRGKGNIETEVAVYSKANVKKSILLCCQANISQI